MKMTQTLIRKNSKINKGTAARLEEKIKNKTIKVGIIGLGYVGLPLAVEFAKAGAEVYGIDIDTRKVKAINAKKSYIQDVAESSLAELVSTKKLKATTDFSV